jgi:hypothetical protein
MPEGYEEIISLSSCDELYNLIDQMKTDYQYRGCCINPSLIVFELAPMHVMAKRSHLSETLCSLPGLFRVSELLMQQPEIIKTLYIVALRFLIAVLGSPLVE